jgi:lipoprotein-releasing system permease protein
MESKLAMVQDPQFPGEKDKFVPRGKFDINGFYSAVIGDGLADGMGVDIGDRILLFSPTDVDTMMNIVNKLEKETGEEERRNLIDDVRERTAPQELTVTGIFDSGHFDFDNNVVFTHLETAQVLYNFDLEECHGIAIRTDDGFKAGEYQSELYTVLPDQYRILTWGQIHKALFDAVAGERQMMYLILFMVVIVASFCTMNTMITVTFQKRAEIGLMKALGAREEQVASVFLFQGIIVGLLGVALGLLIGYLTVHFRNEMAGWLGQQFGINFFSEEVYKVDGGLPAQIRMKDILIISIGSFVLCVIAALIPASVAASMQPAKALRSE